MFFAIILKNFGCLPFFNMEMLIPREMRAKLEMTLEHTTSKAWALNLDFLKSCYPFDKDEKWSMKVWGAGKWIIYAPENLEIYI